MPRGYMEGPAAEEAERRAEEAARGTAEPPAPEMQAAVYGCTADDPEPHFLGWLVFAPVPFLVLAFVIPGLVWLAALGLVVPILVVEEIPVRAALRRAWRLARADFVHALGSLFTLAVVVLLSQSVLVFVLRGFGDAAESVALFLASVVLSPLLFVGAALLYVDQSARKDSIGDGSPPSRL